MINKNIDDTGYNIDDTGYNIDDSGYISFENIRQLEEKAKNIRKHIVEMIYLAGSGHPGGSLSCVDILTSLYFNIMKHKPLEPKWVDRDRFILSKGHAAPALYATLAECGYFPIEELLNLRKIGCRLQGHADSNVPGVDASTGSLGQGLSIACGMSLIGKICKKNFKTYVLLGDGECDEGQVWEAAMFASHYKLDNLVAIIDRNGFQIDGPTEKVMSLEPFKEKWKAFGWNIAEINGNEIKEIITIMHRLEKLGGIDKPSMILANTIKGKGISMMENKNEFHGRAPNKTEYELAIKELLHSNS